MSMPWLESWLKDSIAPSPKSETGSTEKDSSSKKEIQTKKSKKEQQSWRSDTPTQKVPSEHTSEFIVLNTELKERLAEEKKAFEHQWEYPPMKMDHFDFLELINDGNTKRVAKGSFGVVYKVSRPVLENLIKQRLNTTDDTVAIKIFSISMTPDKIKEIGDEVRALREFKHKCQKNHIVCYIGDVEVLRRNNKVGDFFVIMEYIDGPNLRKGVEIYWEMLGQKRMSIGILIKDMMTFIKQGAIAIKTIHALGFAHNDIKPENFVLDDQKKRLVLVDLGLACKTPECQEGFAGGTVMYYSLEKFNEYKKRMFGEKTKGLSLEQLQRADLWAFAIVVETLLSQRGRTNITTETYGTMLSLPRGYEDAFSQNYNRIKMQAQTSKGAQQMIDGYNDLMDMAIFTLSRPIYTENEPWTSLDDYINLVNRIIPPKKQ